MNRNRCIGAFACVLVCVLNSPVSGQGPLIPPGPPAPTMKALDQVEPRIDLNRLTGDASAVRVIAAPGSYYLTANLAGESSKETIRIVTSQPVTIDLNGFGLTLTGAERTAILVQATNDKVLIRNGSIAAVGAVAIAVASISGNQVTCEDLRIAASGGATLNLGSDAVVRRCRLKQGGISITDRGVVHDTRVNATGADISIELGNDSRVTDTQLVTGRGWLSVGERGLVSDCRVNSGGPPTLFVNGTVLQTGGSSVVRNCTVKGSSMVGNAIGVGANSVISHCRVSSVFRDGIVGTIDVTVESCAIEGFGRHGIQLGANARVRDSTVNGGGAGLDGITVGDNSIVSGSIATAIAGAGIIAGNACTITDCTATMNDGNGIQTGSHSTIQGCTARQNQGNGILVAGSCLISDCVTSQNGKKTSPFNATSDGIELGGRNRVVNCNSFSNAQHGIFSSSTNNREYIAGSLMHSNDAFAIFLQGNGNTVIKNQVGGNSGGTINQTGGNIAPLQNASTAGVHPLANFP